MMEVSTKFIICLDTFLAHNHKSNLYASASYRLLMCLALHKIKDRQGLSCFIGVWMLVCWRRYLLLLTLAGSHESETHHCQRSNDELPCAAARKTLKCIYIDTFINLFIINMTGPANKHTHLQRETHESERKALNFCFSLAAKSSLICLLFFGFLKQLTNKF